MLTKLKAWFRNLFVSEVRVMRPEATLNRKQRRMAAAMQRKHRRKHASVSRSKGDSTRE